MRTIIGTQGGSFTFLKIYFKEVGLFSFFFYTLDFVCSWWKGPFQGDGRSVVGRVRVWVPCALPQVKQGKKVVAHGLELGWEPPSLQCHILEKSHKSLKISNLTFQVLTKVCHPERRPEQNILLKCLLTKLFQTKGANKTSQNTEPSNIH